ncbi:hypothetical protein FGO68_gene13922 [Halteria grandinella]|uniref:Uncharacterized protein n=1 Tax=Halteria grandinella TaxID=5974 RepID=A0A8J8T223_HALGN|nr:hypothetical protein FGO68_gene13922 [Halteria grandinella]
MKNIVLLNIVAQFDYDHALSLLFQLCKRSRNQIPKQLPYLQFNLSHYKAVQLKRYYRKQEYLYYDYGYRFLIQTQLTKQNTKKFVLKHISQMNEYNTDSIQMYRQTWHKYDIRKLRVEINVIDPSKADELIELAKEQFPHYEIELVIKENLPGSLKLFYLPQVLEIGTKSEITIELSLLSEIKYVNIIVQHQPFNLILKDGSKLGENASICFHFGEINSKVKSLDVEGFAENYKDSIDFTLCNYKVYWIDPNLKASNKLFRYLQNKNYVLKGEIFFQLYDPQACPQGQHKLVKEYYSNFKFDELSLMAECCNLVIDLDEIICN